MIHSLDKKNQNIMADASSKDNVENEEREIRP